MAREFDLQADLKAMHQVLQRTISQMNARGERFDHPIGALSGLWGNTLYKYQESGRFADAPFGALFDRLYNKDGRYQNIKECYDQAETVLRALRQRKSRLTGSWEFGMLSRPGHYWAGARLVGAGPGQQSQRGPRLRDRDTIYVHMDAWTTNFDVTNGLKSSIQWQAH